MGKYQLQVGRWGSEYETYRESDNIHELIDTFHDDEGEAGLDYDAKSNGKNWFRIVEKDLNHIVHEWIPPPHEGEPYIDISGDNPLWVIAEAYDFDVTEMRVFCQKYLDATKDGQ